MKTAILIDAAFFLKRFPHVYQNKSADNAKEVARTLHEMALGHLSPKDKDRQELYRIFVYDCAPLSKKAHNPISEKAIDFSKTPMASFRNEFHNELKSLRKVALKLGRLSDISSWRLKPYVLKDLLKKTRKFEDLTDDDFVYDVMQKGTDMKIGVDIATLASKQRVDKIVLVTGDADFVPAAKMARREGIDFILDPMWGPIADDLHEHIDGLRSTCPKPVKKPSNKK